jgi:hypothetical protein
MEFSLAVSRGLVCCLTCSLPLFLARDDEDMKSPRALPQLPALRDLQRGSTQVPRDDRTPWAASYVLVAAKPSSQIL